MSKGLMLSEEILTEFKKINKAFEEFGNPFQNKLQEVVKNYPSLKEIQIPLEEIKKSFDIIIENIPNFKIID